MAFAKARGGAFALALGALTAAAAAPRRGDGTPAPGPGQVGALLERARSLRIAGNAAAADALAAQAVTLAEALAGSKVVPRLAASRLAAPLAVAVAPDGRTLASAEGPLIRLWDAASGLELATLRGHTDAVERLAFSPDGKLLASGGRDERVRLWDLGSRREVGALEGHKAWIGALAWSADGTLLASGSGDHHAKVWTVATRSELRALTGPVLRGDSPSEQHANAVTCAAFSPDGAWLATGSIDRQVKVWKLATGEAVAWLEARAATSMLRAVAFSPDGKTLAAAGNDGAVYLWDVATVTTPAPAPPPAPRRKKKHPAVPETPRPPPALEPMKTIAASKDAILTLAFDPAGQLYAADARGAVAVWKLPGLLVHSQPARPGWVQAAAFSPAGDALFSADADHALTLLAIATSTPVERVLAPPARTPLTSLAFDAAGNTLAVGGADGTLVRWDLGTGTPDVHLGAVIPRTPETHAGTPPAIVALAFVRGRLAAARDDGTIAELDQRWNEVETHRAGTVVRAMVVMNDKLAFAGDDGIVRFGKDRFTGHKGSVGALAAGPDFLASGGDDGTIRIWNRQRTVVQDGARVRALAWHDADLVSGDSAGMLRAIEPQSGSHQDKPTGVPITALAALRGVVVSGRSDGTLMLWDGASVPAHAGPVRALAASPSGLLASAGDDGTVRLCDAAGRPLATLLANRASWAVIGDDGAVDGSPDLLEWHAGQLTLPGGAAFAARRVPGLLSHIARKVQP